MKQYYKAIILFFLVLIELLSSTYWTHYIHLNICRYVHFLAGISVSLLLILNFKKDSFNFPLISKWIPFAVMAVLILWSSQKLNHLFEMNPIDYKNADMLPVIKVMVERWLAFKSIYTMIPDIWGGVMPIYLPALYLAYIPSLLFDFDMRWMGYLFVIAPFVFIFWKEKTNLISIGVFIVLGLFFDYVLHQRNETFVLSEEGIVYGYYLLLVYFLYKRNILGVAIIASCCLLSRYAALFFLFALVPCFYLLQDRPAMKKYVTYGIISGILIMSIGRAWTYVQQFLSLSHAYVDNVMNNQSKYQSVLNDGLGLMPLIGIQHTQSMYFIQIFFVFTVAICMVMGVKKFYHKFYFVAFLKLSLVIFYNLLILPYMYLMYTSLFVSIIIYYLYTNQEKEIQSEF